MSTCCWENDTDRFAQCRVAINLQLVNMVSERHNKQGISVVINNISLKQAEEPT